jgi:hypothetical protein
MSWISYVVLCAGLALVGSLDTVDRTHYVNESLLTIILFGS